MISMDSLLCHENLVTLVTNSPPLSSSYDDTTDSYTHYDDIHISNVSVSKEEYDMAFDSFLMKEMDYMPKHGYVEQVIEADDDEFVAARSRAIHWLIKSRSRLKLSYGTMFLAANYFDRFVSICKCQKWELWMVELLSIACLSLASKYTETCITPTLQDIQMEDLDHSFESSTIQRMELIVLKALEWRLGSITPYSYVEMMMSRNLNLLTSHHLQEPLTFAVTELLLHILSDIRFVEFRPSVVAASALKHVIEDFNVAKVGLDLTHLDKFICLDKREDMVKCQKLIEERLRDPCFNSSSPFCEKSVRCPASPVTVLLNEKIDICDCHADLSVFSKHQEASTLDLTFNKKRKREDDQLISNE